MFFDFIKDAFNSMSRQDMLKSLFDKGTEADCRVPFYPSDAVIISDRKNTMIELIYREKGKFFSEKYSFRGFKVMLENAIGENIGAANTIEFMLENKHDVSRQYVKHVMTSDDIAQISSMRQKITDSIQVFERETGVIVNDPMRGRKLQVTALHSTSEKTVTEPVSPGEFKDFPTDSMGGRTTTAINFSDQRKQISAKKIMQILIRPENNN